MIGGWVMRRLLMGDGGYKRWVRNRWVTDKLLQDRLARW